MSLETPLLDEVQTAEASVPAKAPANPAVTDLLAAIVSDASAASQEYLRDTVVPHGGE